MANWFPSFSQERDPQGNSDMRGHPTAPGPTDRKRLRKGIKRPGVDGEPGVPKVLTGEHGPGIPGNTPTGPMQPGAGYDNPEDQE